MSEESKTVENLIVQINRVETTIGNINRHFSKILRKSNDQATVLINCQRMLNDYKNMLTVVVGIETNKEETNEEG